MPFGDGTGPMGLGSMTGRAAGYCAGYPVAGFMNPVPGRGFGGRGRGLGGGWGRGRGWLPAWGAPPYAPYGAPAGALGYGSPYGAAAPTTPFAYGSPYAPQMTPEQGLDLLKRQAEYLEDALEGIRKQMEEVEAEPKKEEK